MKNVCKMASVPSSEDAIFLLESVIRGHHIFKEVWTPRLGEILAVRKEVGNAHDRHAVALVRNDGTIVGHAPREVSRVFWHYLGHGGNISCEVTSRRKYGKGLEVPCTFKFVGSEKMVQKMKSIMQKKSFSKCVYNYLLQFSDYLLTLFIQCHEYKITV